MNTPLGVQGKAHQARRDRHEAIFNKTYGIETAKTPEAKAAAASKGHQRFKFIEARQKSAAAAAKLIGASGRLAPSF